MNVKIKRQRYPGAEPYWQTFVYNGPKDITVASLLDEINYRDDIVDIEGNPAPRIGWECACLQGMCGACAMVICGTPALACETFLRDLKGETVTIEPLTKFPVIADLVVDRSRIEESLKEADAYIRDYKPSEKTGKAAQKEYELQYQTAKCLKCGLCLEVCPNYKSGERFFGALFANDCYLIDSQSGDAAPEIKDVFDEHFAAGCSKSLSCMDVCPMKIETIASIARMSRK